MQILAPASLTRLPQNSVVTWVPECRLSPAPVNANTSASAALVAQEGLNLSLVMVVRPKPIENVVCDSADGQ